MHDMNAGSHFRLGVMISKSVIFLFIFGKREDRGTLQSEGPISDEGMFTVASGLFVSWYWNK